MATTTILSNPVVTIGTTDFTDQCTNATVTQTFEQQDVTTFGDTARKYVGGLGNHEISLTLFTSYGASEVEGVLSGLVGDTGTIKVKATQDAVGVANPEYTLTGAYLESFTPVNSSLGEMSTIEVTFVGGALTRATE